MGCPPTLALFGKAVPDEQRDEYRAQVGAYLKEPQPSSLDGYPSMRAALDAKVAFAAKYPLLDGCIDVILAYDPTRERRQRLRQIVTQAMALEEPYPVDAIPDEVVGEIKALLCEADALNTALDAEDASWERVSILSRLNEVPQATRDAYTAAFGEERDVQMYRAMREGC